jgi:hypothetical protein
MKCDVPGCPHAAMQRTPFKGKATCHKHAAKPVVKRVVRKRVKMDSIKAIHRVLPSGAFALCFPEFETMVGTIAVWTLAEGRGCVTEGEYLHGTPPRSNYELEKFTALKNHYESTQGVLLEEVTRWSADQRKSAWRN